MSVVSLLGVNVMNNPAKFTDQYEFEITFECLEPLQKDLEWKLTYVGSATSDAYDQELDSLLVGPIPVGINKFVFVADPPDTKRIPIDELLGVTVILLTCAYDGREFVRVGYYVNNEYETEELQNNPPAKPIIEKIRRNILAEKPRVTRFAIKWDSEASAPPEFPPEQPEADLVADEEEYGADEMDEEEEEEEEDDAMEGADAEEDLEEEETGSVDLEGESEAEVEGEYDEEGDGADEMEVDDDGPAQGAAGATGAGQKQEAMVH
ncbi:putative histone chaperone protein [Thermochaetoides thermophila DSM 1495]|uniref:Histone chaperone n=1 Tax=Chaetomium thermophilum (strain DSM 1495 / CBS 144.50 / IMI 039719) TaxID=759272 RepID=G0S2D9_CHATD|nr:putative histone chaperone protein [Thermochaetoides thermophila DSM 1495]EGS22172.1 putative histone chaperone protein [Thermochaetoides thermophila DSM 1495]